MNFPVVPTEQYATLNFSLVAAASGGVLRDTTLPVSVDLMDTSAHALAFANSSFTLNVTYQVSPVLSKANTVVILPGDNSTLSNLPLGLKRFTGEQDFVLLAVNDTLGGPGSLSSPAIPYVNATAPNGTSTAAYLVSLSGGMNNLLVPRSLFLHSPLGQVLLLNATNASIRSNGYNRALASSWDPALWQARVLGYSNWNGSNYAPGQPGYLRVFSTTDQNCTSAPECGVVPSDLAVGSVAPSYAVDSIFALNVTNTTQLDSLLAGLLLNASGNFSNWALQATPFLPSLGLSAEVLKLLANPVEFNQGGYGAPVFSGSAAAPPGWAVVGAVIWNAVSGTVTGLLSVAWGYVQAAAAYALYLASEVAQWGLSAIQQTVSVLKQLAGAIVWAIDQLVSLVVAGIQTLLNAILQPAQADLRSYELALNGDLASAWNTVNGTGSVTQSEARAVWTDFGGAPFDVALGLGIAITVALTLLTPIDFGPSFLIGIIIGLITGAVLSGGAFVQGASSLTTSAVFDIENAVNHSVSLPVSEWAAIAGVIGLSAAGSEMPFSWYVLGQAFNVQGAPVTELSEDALAITVVAIMSISIGAIAVVNAGPILLLFAFALAILSLVGVTVHYFDNEFMDENPPLKRLGLIDLGLSGAAMAGSGADLLINLGLL